MRLLRWLLRRPRALGALLLLTTLVGGEVADARHHILDPACAGESHAPGSREQNCTCAALHAVPLGIEPVELHAPILLEREVAPEATTSASREHRGADAAPRAPPRG